MKKETEKIGYIFRDRTGDFMIDTGPVEYQSSEVLFLEIWDGEKFIPAMKEEIRFPQMSGVKARFRVKM
ncbi:hypothetical protein [Brevibacillus reuszeri]|uniref:hypothetical protein n=1 Tax=Brevibacillus reuszeri TaxID=54915 RepID=UPI000CCC3FB7|nr:hypothetical protein [Brevibacillus reuszeri]